MAYRFAGFFAKPPVDQPDDLPPGAVWRSITAPFSGVGVRIPALLGETPEPEQVEQLSQELGLDAAADLIYLTYDTWGRIDFVYGLVVRDGEAFGPLECSDVSEVEGVYLTLMGEFGIRPEDALNFPPFVRGFWGEE